MRVIVNFVGFQIGWFACVLGAAYGKPWVGPLVVLFLFLVHLALSGEKPREVALALAAAVIGFAFDSLLIAAGTFFPARDFFPAPLSLFSASSRDSSSLNSAGNSHICPRQSTPKTFTPRLRHSSQNSRSFMNP